MTISSDRMLAMLSGLDDSSVSKENFVKGPFFWNGHKYGSLSQVLPLLPYRRAWVDVFGGSGVVTANRQASNLEVFNDRNSGITAFYRCLRRRETLDQLIDLIQLMPHSREEFITCFKGWEDETDDLHKAAMFYYSIQSSFAGVGRTFGRVTNGRSAIGKKIREGVNCFDAIHHRFRDVQIENLDWRQVIIDYDAADAVFYFDPPYVRSNTYKHKMSLEDHDEMCQRIMRMQGFVALSGYDNEVYSRYKWDHVYEWTIKDDKETRVFNKDFEASEREGARGARTEMLWIKK